MALKRGEVENLRELVSAAENLLSNFESVTKIHITFAHKQECACTACNIINASKLFRGVIEVNLRR